MAARRTGRRPRILERGTHQMLAQPIMRTLTCHQNQIRDAGFTTILKEYHLQQPIWSARGMSAYPWGRTWAIAEARVPHSPRRSWQQMSTPLQQPARRVYASWASSRGRPDPPKERGTGEHCPQSQQLRHWRCSHRLPAVSRFRVSATQTRKCQVDEYLVFQLSELTRCDDDRSRRRGLLEVLLGDRKRVFPARHRENMGE